AAAHPAGRIDGKNRQVVAIDVDADRKAPFRVDLELDRRLSAQAVPAPGFEDQSLVEQPVDDPRDTRLGQPGLPRDFGSRDRGIAADRLQHQSPIVLARLPGIRTGEIRRNLGRRSLASDHPLTAPAVIAPRIIRCSARNTMIAGTTEIRHAAASTCVELELIVPSKLKMPTPIGILFVLVSSRKVFRNCDPPAITVMMNTDAIPGPHSGRMMRQKVVNREQPSIMAASSRLVGMPSMAPFSSHDARGTPSAI